MLILSRAIGANSVWFNIANTLLFRPDPGVSNAETLVRIGERSLDGTSDISYAGYRAYAAANSFLEMAARRAASMNVGTKGSIERVECALVTANYFAATGVVPARGHGFAPGEDSVKGSPP